MASFDEFLKKKVGKNSSRKNIIDSGTNNTNIANNANDTNNIKKLALAADDIGTTPMYKDYFAQQMAAEKQYGEKSIVLIEVGMFFEIYEIEDVCGKAQQAASILGFQLTRKNTNESHNNKNPYMTGGPKSSLDKMLIALVSAGFTVIVMEQYTTGGSNSRYVSRKVSPSTIGIYSDVDGRSILFGLHLILEGGLTNLTICTGYCAMIDLITGKTHLYMAENTKKDTKKAENNIYRFIHSVDPSEILYSWEFKSKLSEKNKNEVFKNKSEILEKNKNEVFKNRNEVLEKEIKTRLDICESTHYRDIQDDFKKANYQNEFFNKIFGNLNSNLSHIEEMNLALLSDLTSLFIHTLQFAKEHDESIIKYINKPIILSDQQNLILNDDSIYQLSVITKKGNKSLTSITDFTITNMGKRLHSERLLNPSTNIEEIKLRYIKVAFFKKDKEIRKKCRNRLKQIIDIEKFHRRAKIKITNKKFAKNNFIGKIAISYNAISQLLDDSAIVEIIINDDSVKKNIKSKFDKFLNEYNDIFVSFNSNNTNLESITKSNIVEKINNFPHKKVDIVFREGLYKNVDKLMCDLVTIYEQLESKLANYKSKLEESKRGETVKLNRNDKNGFYFTCSKARLMKLKKNDDEIRIFGPTASLSKFTTDKIDELSDECEKLERKLSLLIDEKFSVCLKIFDKHSDLLNDISDFIAQLDVSCSAAHLADLFCYYEPEIINKDHDTNCNNESYFYFEDIRHPIIERIIDTPYDKTTIGLNCGKYVFENNYEKNHKKKNKNNSKEKNCKENIIEKNCKTKNTGLLLFGANASGKSSILRAIGCNVIMAQAGLFVPSKMKYWPYKQIISKISNSDDLYKGRSTFVTEMYSLKNMIVRADSNSLILADELCSGTEIQSACSIVAAGIEHLVNKKATFIFTTHMHKLLQTPIVRAASENGNLRICHFKIIVDNCSGSGDSAEITYDRNFHDGPGDTMYGLEIARFLNLGNDFIRSAFSTRNKLVGKTDKILNVKKSNYNSKLFMHECSRCHRQADEIGQELHTHHKVEQSNADEYGNIEGGFHKNKLSNLEVLCNDCHKKEHNCEKNEKNEKSETIKIEKSEKSETINNYDDDFSDLDDF